MSHNPYLHHQHVEAHALLSKYIPTTVTDRDGLEGASLTHRLRVLLEATQDIINDECRKTKALLTTLVEIQETVERLNTRLGDHAESFRDRFFTNGRPSLGTQPKNQKKKPEAETQLPDDAPTTEDQAVRRLREVAADLCRAAKEHNNA